MFWFSLVASRVICFRVTFNLVAFLLTKLSEKTNKKLNNGSSKRPIASHYGLAFCSSFQYIRTTVFGSCPFHTNTKTDDGQRRTANLIIKQITAPVQCMFRIFFTLLVLSRLPLFLSIGMEGRKRKSHTTDNETEDATPPPKPPNNRA